MIQSKAKGLVGCGGSRRLHSPFRSAAVTEAPDGPESGNGCCQPSLQKESLSFMKAVMDECTHMANFSGELDFLQPNKTFLIRCATQM